MKDNSLKRLQWAAVISLLAAGFLVQNHFARAYPQPVLFGDPGAYHRVGMELKAAVSAWQDGASLNEAYESFRPYAYLVGTGSVYAIVNAVRGATRSVYEGLGGSGQTEWLKPLPYFRIAWALINTVGMLGVFLLARQLSGSFSGGLLALAGAVIYPSFSTQSPRLFPDPVFSTLFVWSAYYYVRGVKARSAWSMATSGFMLSCGFFVRPQFMNYFPILTGAVALTSLPFWIRTTMGRKLAFSFLLAVVPSMILWSAISRSVGDELETIENFGFFAFPQQQRYPYGFWLFLDSDGWVGPYQLKEYPFYLEMLEEAKDKPGFMSSRRRQLGFTVRYVGSRLGEAALLVLDNIYRLYDRPANDYRWDYPFDIRHQTTFQRIVMVLAVCGIVAFTIETPPMLLVSFVPMILCGLYGLSTPKPRYGQPAMFILIALAGAFVAALVAHRPEVSKRLRSCHRGIGLTFLAGLILTGLGAALRLPFPEAARLLRAVGVLSLLAVPFWLVWFSFGQRAWHKLLVVGTWASITLVVAAHFARDRNWHEVELELGKETRGVVQEILLPASARNRLRTASQSFLLFDIYAPSGELEGIEVEVSGRIYPQGSLVPAMPYMGESTSAGGKNPRRYRQWWALAFDPELLPQSPTEPLKIQMNIAPEHEGPSIYLYGDRFEDQERVYEGPSFGNWPYVAAPKLEYDGDHRLSIRRPLESAGTESYWLERDGGRVSLPSVLRIRVITLESNEAHFGWKTAAWPRTAEASAFFAFSYGSADAELFLDGKLALRFPLASEEDFEVENGSFHLCHRARPRRGEHMYGGFLLSSPPRETEDPVAIMVRYRSGMSNRAMSFSVDANPEPSSIRELSRDCGLGDESDLVERHGRDRKRGDEQLSQRHRTLVG